MNHARLVDLYNRISKHSHYQILAAPLRKHVPTSLLKTQSRHEQERLDYILRYAPYCNATLVDIGGNTGFFTFELLDRGAKSALFIEGNEEHCTFVNEAANALGWGGRVTVRPAYMDFTEGLSGPPVDLCLLLNVLHHVGDDYGDPALSLEAARQSILHSLSRMARHARSLVFQLGFNWKGNKNLPLFANGTKAELIDFIESGTRDTWAIQKIGIAEPTQCGIAYRGLAPTNIHRQDSIGEFLNRPLFIMKSKTFMD